MTTTEHEPEAPRVSRRSFFPVVPVVATMTGGIVLSEFDMARRIMRESYDVDSSALAMIQERSQQIAEKFEIAGFDTPVYYQNRRKFNVYPNTEAIAQAILLLAYRDGGIEKTQQVEKVIQERGLSIVKSDIISLASFGAGKPMSVNFSPSLFGTLYLSEQSTTPFPYADYIVFHEFYHLVQSASLTPEEFNDSVRDDQYLALAVPTFLSLLDGFKEWVERKENLTREPRVDREDNLMDRRAALSRSLEVGYKMGLKLSIKAIFAFFVAQSLLVPIEQEASLRGSGFYTRLPGLLTMHPVFDTVRGKLFSFEEIKP